MRISQLAEQTGVTVATIKFYLRTKLIPEGTFTHSNQAQYSERHATLIRLARTLLHFGAIPHNTIQRMFNAEPNPETLNGLLGDDLDDRCAKSWTRHPRADIAEVIANFGWETAATGSARNAAAEALNAAEALGVDLTPYLHVYAQAAEDIAWADTALYAIKDPDERRAAVLAGTILGNQLFAALRILAQESLIRKAGA